jgi:hypothetical protein
MQQQPLGVCLYGQTQQLSEPRTLDGWIYLSGSLLLVLVTTVRSSCFTSSPCLSLSPLSASSSTVRYDTTSSITTTYYFNLYSIICASLANFVLSLGHRQSCEDPAMHDN